MIVIRGKGRVCNHRGILRVPLKQYHVLIKLGSRYIGIYFSLNLSLYQHVLHFANVYIS